MKVALERFDKESKPLQPAGSWSTSWRFTGVDFERSTTQSGHDLGVHTCEFSFSGAGVFVAPALF